MIVTFSGQDFSCIKAVKAGDNAFLYLEDGGTVELRGVSDWSVFSLDGGDWSLPEPEPVVEYATYAELAAAIREGVNLV